MEAQIIKDGEITIVALRGYLDFETTEPFRKTCFQNLIDKNIVFDLKNLNFIGSSGLTSFLEVLREFKQKNPQPVKFCGLSQEFKRLFWATSMHDMEIYEDSPTAFASFYQPMQQIARIQYVELDSEVEITEDSISQEDEKIEKLDPIK